MKYKYVLLYIGCMEQRVRQRERELQDLKQKKDRYFDGEPASYRERLYFAGKRLYGLDCSNRDEFLNEVSVITKFLTGCFTFLLVTVLALKYAGVIGWISALVVTSMLLWISFENERELRNKG